MTFVTALRHWFSLDVEGCVHCDGARYATIAANRTRAHTAPRSGFSPAHLSTSPATAILESCGDALAQCAVLFVRLLQVVNVSHAAVIQSANGEEMTCRERVSWAT